MKAQRPLHHHEVASARPYQIIFSGQHRLHPDGRVETLPLSEDEQRQLERKRETLRAAGELNGLEQLVRTDPVGVQIADLRGRTFYSEDGADAALKIALGPEALEQRIEQMTRHYELQARHARWQYTWEGSRCHEIRNDDGEIDRKALAKVAKRCIEALITEGMIPGDKGDYRISVRQPSHSRGWYLLVRIPYEWEFSAIDAKDALALALIPWLSSKAVDNYDYAGAYSQSLSFSVDHMRQDPADMPKGLTSAQRTQWWHDRMMAEIGEVAA